jgi:hypothetical protein
MKKKVGGCEVHTFESDTKFPIAMNSRCKRFGLTKEPVSKYKEKVPV